MMYESAEMGEPDQTQVRFSAANRLRGLYGSVALLGAVVVALSCAVLVLLLAPANPGTQTSPDPYSTQLSTNVTRNKELRALLMGTVVPENMYNDMKQICQHVHIAGSAENKRVQDYIINKYSQMGYHVREFDYQVYTTQPDWTQPNTLSVQQSTDQLSWTTLSDGLGQRLGPEEAQKEMDDKSTIWWNSWSADGKALGSLVYANYGTDEDFWYLGNETGISVKDKLVLIRMGGIWRGAKVAHALESGAAGVVLFMDPADYALQGHNFPNDMHLPAQDAQRGSTKNVWGDQGTPFYPAKSYVYRNNSEADLRERLIIPDKPVMTISYGHAQAVFASMDGSGAPVNFTGALNTTYKLSGSAQYKLTVASQWSDRTPIKCICSFLYGASEPDHVVLTSNHYDSYTTGAFDPNSGTVMQMETARSLMSVVNSTGWRPRRSVAFCHWDAEEFGLVGSAEWMEEMLKPMHFRAVALVNTDMALYGNDTLDAEGTPGMLQALFDAAALVDNPNANEITDGYTTVLDSWKRYFPHAFAIPGIQPPLFYVPGAGSDHYVFMSYAGMPVVSYMYGVKEGWAGFKLYHSMYEVPWTVANIVDPGFKVHKAMAQLTVELVRSLSDSLVVPFNLLHYGQVLERNVLDLNETLVGSIHIDDAFDVQSTMSRLQAAVTALNTSITQVQGVANQLNAGTAHASLVQVHMLNQRMVAFERMFLAERGIYSERPLGKHVLFTASEGKWAGGLSNGVRECAHKWRHTTDKGDIEQSRHWLAQTQLALNELQYSIESANQLLAMDGY